MAATAAICWGSCGVTITLVNQTALCGAVQAPQYVEPDAKVELISSMS